MFILEKLINCCFVLLGLFQMGKFGDAFILEKELEMQRIEIQRLHSENQRLYHDGNYLQHQLHLRELASKDLRREIGNRTSAIIQKALELVARLRTTEAELALARYSCSMHPYRQCFFFPSLFCFKKRTNLLFLLGQRRKRKKPSYLLLPDLRFR